MRGNADIGQLRTIYINNLPLAVSSIDDFFPKQNIAQTSMLQGGGRTVIYEIKEKTIEGSITCPLCVDKNGSVTEGCRELLRCADNPTRNLNLVMNFGVMGEPKTATTYTSRGAETQKRLTIATGVITDLTLSIDKEGPVSINCKIQALPDKENENDYNFEDIPIENYMARQCSYADCLICQGEQEENYVFLDSVNEFKINFSNKIDPLYLLRKESTDYASELALEETVITGEWTEIKKASEFHLIPGGQGEIAHWMHGGYYQDVFLKFFIADISGAIRDLLYKPQTQPLGIGILKRKTEFIATWRYGWVSEIDNLVFENL
jgi:hypothetical protein